MVYPAAETVALYVPEARPLKKAIPQREVGIVAAYPLFSSTIFAFAIVLLALFSTRRGSVFVVSVPTMNVVLDAVAGATPKGDAGQLSMRDPLFKESV